MKSECQSIQEKISENGVQAQHDDPAVAAHLASCSECQQFMRAFEELSLGFAELRAVEVPEVVVTKVFQKLERGFMDHSSAAEQQKKSQNRKFLTPQQRRIIRRVVGAGAATSMVAVIAIVSLNTLGREASVSFQRIGSSISGNGVPAGAIHTPNQSQNENQKTPISQGGRKKTEEAAYLKEREGMFQMYADSMESISRHIQFGDEATNAPSAPASHIVVAPQTGGIAAAKQNADILVRQQGNYGTSSITGTPAGNQFVVLGERYGQYEENAVQQTLVQPVSTFSIDVDTGSYTNVRRMLSQGITPPADSVRIEEFINYFDYNYPVEPGEQPFTLSYEVAPSPLAKGKHLLKVGIRAQPSKPINEDKGWNLVFLIDTSGSMTDADKLPLLKESLSKLVNRMRPHDRIGIVTYAGSAGVALESTAGNDKQKILNAIQTLESGGSTNGAGGIVEAYKLARASRMNDGVNRVILATDGDFNVGITSFEDLVDLVENERKSGITLTTLGFGQGNYNERNLEQLANKGNGNYFYIDSLEEGQRVLDKKLVSNMEVVAKDVKLQLEFNPDHVTSYRLIGYDNRRLANEDFNNDAIDAGEIGAGHTVTALFEVTLANAPIGIPDSELRYQGERSRLDPQRATNRSHELGFLKVRFKEPNGSASKLLTFPVSADSVKSSLEKASSDFRFAAAVAGFGQVLRKSAHAGEVSLSKLAEIAEGALNDDPKRKELLELIGKAKQQVN